MDFGKERQKCLFLRFAFTKSAISRPTTIVRLSVKNLIEGGEGELACILPFYARVIPTCVSLSLCQRKSIRG